LASAGNGNGRRTNARPTRTGPWSTNAAYALRAA
jgi:hypothetical protein